MQACAAIFVSLLVAPTLALAQGPESAPAATADRPPTHRVCLGVGATWTDPGRFRRPIHPGTMVGFDLALGRHAALGLLGDFTYIGARADGPPPVSTNHRLIAGLEFKFLPLRSGSVRPWVAVGAAGSVVHDTGYGWGIGAGVRLLPDKPIAFFTDVRRYWFFDMENPNFEQVMLRAGVAL